VRLLLSVFIVLPLEQSSTFMQHLKRFARSGDMSGYQRDSPQ